jgi:hypothetical protein
MHGIQPSRLTNREAASSPLPAALDRAGFRATTEISDWRSVEEGIRTGERHGGQLQTGHDRDGLQVLMAIPSGTDRSPKEER